MSKINNLTPFTFESSGESVFIRPIPVMLIQAMEKSIPVPQPPMQEVENADGTRRLEANRAHPDYLAALAERNSKVRDAMTALALQRGVFVKLTDEQRDEARALRAEVAGIGTKLEDDDAQVWLKYIACQSAEDLSRLLREVTAKSVPSDPKSQSGLSSSTSPSEATTSGDAPPSAAASATASS